ncbi:MAG: ferrous iron transport protein B [Methanobrevibacter sp.]|uniref:ferrous iron transport protein B n=1 Tax=Methanobrevibacter sp. TaxID=66852 RepID=UPI0026E011B0|nr:ferrous iron transport protein B [Methanobrevibacter sp.]MDO5848021.1 ferrous iron transport protein B [Methanobrevibacter sp.]
MRELIVGLAGNPNVGKTTVFNQLTGMHQHVGNWPGKTVEKAEGHFEYDGVKFDIVDLPGNYSLSAHSIEEIVSRDFIVDESSDVIINVVDAANLERNLYLTVQMMELDANLILALNMNDFAKRKEHYINIDLMSELLGFPVIEIDAKHKEGFDELLKTTIHQANHPVHSSKKLVYGDELKEHLGDIQDLIEQDHVLSDVPSLWVAIKLLENDEIIVDKVKNAPHGKIIMDEVKKVDKHLYDIFKEDGEEIIANARYAFIDGLVKEVVSKPDIEKPSRTDRIDNIVTNRILGIPIFLIILYCMFQIVFSVGAPFEYLINQGFDAAGRFIISNFGNTITTSFLVDGLIGGVGGVVIFLPQIALMFLVISILEDSGYLARAAFVMDRVMHKLVGLHGKAFIPMILGFGCGVPGIMATRTMENESDRLLTMMIIPFMSCTSRLPVYALFIAAFFTAYQGQMLFAIYLIGILIAIIVAFILKRTIFKGMSSPFVMELPSYKIPSLKGVLLHTWEKTKDFLKKAGSIILVASIIIWILGYFPLGVQYADHQSLIGQLGSFIAPIFAPLGFGQWEPTVALLFGIVSKEVVIGTFSALFGSASGGIGIETAIHTIFTPLTAFVFMIFVLLYVPCFATLATIKQETNSWKWPIVMVMITTGTAYIVSFIIYHIGLFIGFT